MEFSLLMSIYYHEEPTHFEECMQSICASTVQPEQIVLVEDGEIKSELKEIIKKYQTILPIETIPLAKNVGLGEALAIGLRHCRHSLVARFDTDDILHKDRFAKQIEFFEKNDQVVLVGTQIQEFSHQTVLKSRTVPVKHDDIQTFAMYRNPFNHMSVMFKKEVVEQVGSYKDLSGFEDYYLWLRILDAGYKTANIDEQLVFARAGEDLVKRRGGLPYARKVYHAYKRFKKENLIPKRHANRRKYAQVAFSLLPHPIRKQIYHRMLRK